MYSSIVCYLCLHSSMLSCISGFFYLHFNGFPRRVHGVRWLHQKVKLWWLLERHFYFSGDLHSTVVVLLVMLESVDNIICVCWCSYMIRAGSGVVRIDPLRFLSECQERRVNQVLPVFSLSTGFKTVFWVVYFCFDVSFRWYVFCLLVVLVKLSLLAKWLARKTPLRLPNRGEGLYLQSWGRRVFMTFSLLSCFIVCLSFVPRPYTTYICLCWNMVYTYILLHFRLIMC